MDTNIDRIMGRLSGYLDSFDGVLRHGHQVYEQYPPELVVDHDASTQAHCTYRHILAEAMRTFEGNGLIRHLELRGQNLWLIEDATVVVRFKKTDENGVSANYPTKQARDFDCGEIIPGLPPEPVRLNVGYLLDETGMGFARSQVALPVGRGVMWCAAIIPQDERESGDVAWRDVTQEPRFGTE